MAQSRPRVGITRWEDVAAERFADYCDRISEAGGEPIELASSAQAGGLEGLVLTGGIDVDPACYGDAPHQKVKRVDPARDAFELSVLRDILDRDIPVLAICRGHQLLNVAFGGKLLQHIEDNSHRADFRQPDAPSSWHDARLEEGTRLRAWLGAAVVEVNSRHHQAVTAERLAPGLRPIAHALDGLIEAIESESHRWVIGVQWHPERLEPEHPAFRTLSRPLFEAFIAATSTVAEAVR